jgi:hypothetical protein
MAFAKVLSLINPMGSLGLSLLRLECLILGWVTFLAFDFRCILPPNQAGYPHEPDIFNQPCGILGLAQVLDGLSLSTPVQGVQF